MEVFRKLWGGAGAAVVTVALVWAGLLEPLESWSLDRLFERRGPRVPTTPIVIVTIDDSSFVELDTQWPFPRALHGKLLDRISAGRPLAIGLDVLFASESSPGDDAALGAAVTRAGNVVLAAARSEDARVLEGDEGTPVSVEHEVPNLPIPVIRAGAAAYGPVNLYTDPDGLVRATTISLRLGDHVLLGFHAAIHQVARNAGLAAAPLPKVPSVLINFRGGPGTFPRIPYYRVVLGEVEPEEFRGKIVLVGSTSRVLHDVHSTPFARNRGMPGVEIQANAIETLVNGDPIREAPVWASVVLAVVAALFASALVARLRALRALGATVLLGVALALGAYACFALWDAWLRAVAGTLALVLGYGSTVVEHFVREQREKRRLSRFFSPDVLRAIVRDWDERKSLGASRRLVTVLFSDLRGFTSISEKLPPEQVAEMVREYLTEMTEIVFKHGGTGQPNRDHLVALSH